MTVVTFTKRKFDFKYKVRAIYKGVWRDLKGFTRYKANLVGWLIEIVTMIFGFLVIGGAYSFSPDVLNLTNLSDGDVFLFMLTGASLQVFAGIATWAPLMRVEEDIHYGTLEAVFVTPTSRLGYLLSTTIARALVSFVFFIPLFITTLAVSGSILNFPIIAFTLLITLASVISMISVGLFFGMLAILFRQTRMLVQVMNMLIQFLCGAYLPVQGFVAIHPVGGPILKYIAMVFPFTYCFDLMRFFLLGAQNYIPLLPWWIELIILFGCAIIYTLFAVFMLKFVEKKAKNQGLSML